MAATAPLVAVYLRLVVQLSSARFLSNAALQIPEIRFDPNPSPFSVCHYYVTLLVV